MKQVHINDGNERFYLLEKKIPFEELEKYKFNNQETKALAKERWIIESHWLAVWNNYFEPLFEGDVVEFDISSSRFYSTMFHGPERLSNVRNINVQTLHKYK